MDEGKIYITISDTRSNGGGNNGGGNDGGSGTSVLQKEINAEDKKADSIDPFKNYIQHSFYNFVENQAKQMLNYSISNIGNFTGDYQTQRDIQSIVNVSNFGVSLITSFMAGMAIGGVAGGIVASGIAVASKGINLGLSEWAGRVNNRNQNYSISQLREISGLDALTNGGR